MQSQPVTITLALKKRDLPSNQSRRKKLLKDLVVFIEHIDGTNELVRGNIITKEEGTLIMGLG
ncbi:hypothetical protein [Falsibacillus albus]|uniref:Uncharacterized protein n=1 Tax=Falsibacillus albus TaxID=2478915 RepID=A0A3L7K7W9_9BACI|nr:hypothetical protein [Falsibacillus albus]RLQ96822.1 hypothetical protein D9X91_06905 [Falsibacillus albus]